MITLEQIELLDSRVKKAVELISSLRLENSLLRENLESCESRTVELEKFVEEMKSGQGQIELGINNLLDTLDFVDTNQESTVDSSSQELEIDSYEPKEESLSPDLPVESLENNTEVIEDEETAQSPLQEDLVENTEIEEKDDDSVAQELDIF